AWLVRSRRYDHVASLIWLSLSASPARSRPLDGASMSVPPPQGTPIVPAVVERGVVSNVPPLLPRPALARKERGEVRKILRHRADHLGDLFDDLADLVFADDQGRGQRQRVAGDPQHQVVV